VILTSTPNPKKPAHGGDVEIVSADFQGAYKPPTGIELYKKVS